MSFSCATSHLNAAPLIGAATERAPLQSRSATTTLAAPARWKASHRALPMPLAPPVTTTTLPATCIVTSRFYLFSGQNQIEHRGVMAGCAQQDETMPDHVLEAQPPPGMKNHAETIERAAHQHQPQRHLRQRGHDPIVKHYSAPAERQIEPDREAIEAAGPAQLERNAENRDTPDADQKRNGE